MTAVPDIAFSLVLALCAIIAAIVARRARGDARFYLHFAVALYIAFSLANAACVYAGGVFAGFFAGGMALFVSALGPCAFVLALASSRFARPRSGTVSAALLIALLCALAGMATGVAVFAFAPLCLSVCAMLAMASRVWRDDRRVALTIAVSAVALLAGAAAFTGGGEEGRTVLALFSAVSVLGVSLGLMRVSRARVKDPRQLGFAGFIFPRPLP